MVGDQLTYTVSFANTGPTPVVGAVPVDQLPDDLAYVSDSGGGVYDAAAHTVTFPATDLPVDGSVSFDVVVTVADTAVPEVVLRNAFRIANPSETCVGVESCVPVPVVEHPCPTVPGSSIDGAWSCAETVVEPAPVDVVPEAVAPDADEPPSPPPTSATPLVPALVQQAVERLPRTGLDYWPLVLIGFGMVVWGAAFVRLNRSAAPDRPRPGRRG